MDYVGIGLTLFFGFLAFAVKDMPPAIAWGGVAVGLVFLVWKHIPVDPKYTGALILAAMAFILAVSASAWGISAWMRPAPPKADPKPAPGRLFVECFTKIQPLMPAEGVAWFFSVQPTPIENGGGGLGQLFGTPGNAMFPKGHFPIYECKITNYFKETVFDVSMELHVTQQEAVSDPQNKGAKHSGKVVLERDWLILIPKIDPGPATAFVFYASNPLDRFATVLIPASGRARIGDNAVAEPIAINAAYNSKVLSLTPYSKE